MATSPDSALRNGEEAMRLASRASQLTASRDPAILGTLAAACAETEDYDKAIETEKEAVSLATQQGKTDLAAALKDRIPLFKARRPIRQK